MENKNADFADIQEDLKDLNPDVLIKKTIEKIKLELNLLENLHLFTKQKVKEQNKVNYEDMSKEELIKLLTKRNVEAENTKITSDLQKSIETQKRKTSMDVKLINQKKFDIVKIVLTGGPCAGKTTAITTVADKLRENGYQVFIVPEAASIIFNSGGDLNLMNYSDAMKIKFQYFLLMLQMSLEDIFCGLATTNENSGHIIILCDRGSMDGSSYMSKQLWNTLLNDFDLNESKIRDKRYDLVIHLSTSADGAEKFYNNSNNEARHENIKFALELDMKLQEAWIAHPNFVQINNNDFTCFNEKINQVVKTIFHFLGLPEDIKFFKKFIISNPKNTLIKLLEQNHNILTQEFDISDIVFFNGKENWTYFRKRITKNTKSFIKCEKYVTQNVFREKRRQISYREYLSAKTLFSKNKYITKKKRNCFMWNKKFFVIDTMKIDGIFFSVCVIHSNQDKIWEIMPEIIEKNIIKEVSNKVVSIFSELVAQENTDHTEEFITEDLKSKMVIFKE